MKSYKLFITLLAASFSIGGFAQKNQKFDTSKLQTIMPAAYRQGEVLVKFKGSTDIAVRRNAKGRLMVNARQGITQLMDKLHIEEMEPLMPLTGNRVSARKVKSFTGKELEDTDLSKLYLVKFDTPAPEKVTGLVRIAPSRTLVDAIDALQELDEVEFAEPNFIVHTQAMDGWGSNDPLYSQQWSHTEINVPGLWDATQGKVNVLGHRPVIAIIDTGVDVSHPDLSDNIWTNPKETADDGVDNDGNGFKDDVHGWDFVNKTGIVGDYNGHGTHCAGIAAAVGGNGKGIVGANPEALIMPISVLQSNGGGDVATIIKGIDYAYANGADVISMSLGGYDHSIAEEQALAKAYSKCIIVAAAGNDNRCITDSHIHIPAPMPLYPGAFTFVIGVQATTPGGWLANFSNYDDDGPLFSRYNEERLYNYEISAPGTGILSTYPGGRYIAMNGTSMATPLVAGVLSRVIQYKETNSTENLLGDLIHTSAPCFTKYGGQMDALALFNISDADRQPNLHLLTVEYSDSLGGKDQDGRIDAGEIIDIYPTLRNDWGETRGGVTLHVEFADNEDQTLGEFIVNDVPLGCDLSSYGKVKSQNPIRLKLRDNIVDGRVVRILLTAQCENMSDEYEPEEFTFKVENGVELGGTQREDITLYPGIQYIVTRNWGIPKDIKVTVKAGTTIKIKDNVGISNYGNMFFEGTRDSMITITKADLDVGNIGGFLNDNARVVEFNYVIFENFYNITFDNHRYNNCIIRNNVSGLSVFTSGATFKGCEIYNNKVCEPYFEKPCGCHIGGKIGWFSAGSTFIETSIHDNIFNHGFGSAARFYKSNYIGNETLYAADTPDVRILEQSNCFGNYYDFKGYPGNPYYKEGFYSVVFETTEPEVFYLSDAYLGTASEKVAYAGIMDAIDNIGWGEVDVAQMLDMAVEEAPVCVDYVKIDGLNPLDDAERMSPLGVGEHTVEVGFNRAMDQSVMPFVTMGLRPPYTQKNIGENGHWFDPYTFKATFTINGKSATDGTNRIRVADYKQKNQDPQFSGPIEKYRYNVLVSAAGSMSTGMMAEPGLGKVTLNWQTDEEDFEDLMGYNLYRFTISEEGVHSDSVLVNNMLILSDETSYVDYDVTPGQTYYYYVKEIGTDLVENFVSSTVAATPLTAQKGDANGSLSVDIADVMTIIAYLSDENPQPFIFEAADVNNDGEVNILDVVGTLRIITAPKVDTEGVEEQATAYCYFKDGKLYVDSPVAIGGVQLLLNNGDNMVFGAGRSLCDMEQLSAQVGAGEKVFLAYSMSGKVLSVGESELMAMTSLDMLSSIILCTPRGGNISVVFEDADGIALTPVESYDNKSKGIYDLMGRRLTTMPKKGVVIVDGRKVSL